MRARSIVIAGIVATVLVMGPAALAKGPSGAAIEGDGVKGTLVVDQAGELGQGTAMSQLVEAAGFFELTFGDSADVVSEAPTKTLGKQRIVITWDMAEGDTIVQEIYHHAEGGPVTYVAPGQKFWQDTDATAGGWLRITRDIATPLIELGVDAEAFTMMGVSDAGAPAPEVKQPVTADPTKIAGAAPAVGPAAQERAPVTERTTGSGAAVPLVIAVVAVLAIMGTAAWMLRRRPILR